ncbi:uncharacterized protein BT62DRAFT_954741 [Guyanagaster necrorhizus]|uniref:EF-hand domain-containing protein n=1 Tax=Guyanagaster necrorhizus TaxID=856835 RepID=A0A9P8ANT4_9AGAR|nr:uncharacterized protein BT62DRAFT_954741 [Guyanagaster necrorhizus MCA 3950]KAG7442638.1 hypothetical protein BT62DRAFT_954741 [Guyanagaster necrorhizus MCA 3950]
MEKPLPLPKISINGTDADSNDVPEDLHRQQSLDTAYDAAYSKIELSKTQKKVDKLMDTIDLSGISTSYASFNTWYTANESAIESAATAIGSLSLDTKSIDSTLNSFAETSEVVMKGLDALGQLHPFVGVAVLAFKLVITLDMTRRGNNKKVLAVKLQMQDTMIVLFQLRHIKDPKEVGRDGTTIEDRMGSLMEAIAKDIRETGSACDHYLKKGFLAKTMKSKIYETRLAGYAAKFTKYREDIDYALQIHTALGVESANAKLDVQDKTLKSMDRKLDQTVQTMEAMMMSVFRKLDTARERDIQAFIKEKGGVKACIDNEQLLHELIDKSGEGIAGVFGPQSGTGESWSAAKAKVQKEMLKEWSEDVEQALQRNIVHFEKKLVIQHRQLASIFKDSLKSTESHILSAMASGAHDRVINEDLKELWKDMAWRGSVKAKHLILALHDYFIDKLGALSASPMMSPGASEAGSPIFSPISAVNDDFFYLKCKNDRWALMYFNVSHVQPIIEAVDDDATGFITTKEINTFTKSMPPGWTLPQWIAYWAGGWHVSVDRYKKKIHMILSTMYKTFPHVLPVNREAVATYLQYGPIYLVDRLLRSTRDVSPNALESSELRRLTKAYTESEEARLMRNLADVLYEIDAKSTVFLITGPGRIERYIYPMLYLLLRHHLRIVRLSTRFVLDQYEMQNMSASLWNLFSVFEHRMQNVASIFKQSNVDVVEKLENFAFGMFKLSYNNPERRPSESSISDYVNEDPTIDEEGTESITDIPLSILRYPLPDTSGSDMYNLPSDFTEEAPEDPIQGQWTGHLYYEHKSDICLVQLLIDSVIDGALTGRAVTWKWSMNISGDIKEDNKVYIRLAFDDGDFVDLTGELDTEKGIIKGWCKYLGATGNEEEHDSDEQSPDDEGGGDQGDDNGDQGGAEENKDGDAVSQGGDQAASEEGTGRVDSSTPQNDETAAAEESHSGAADPESNEADVDNHASQASDGSGSTDPESENYYYKFILRRTPASLCRFLPGDERVFPVANEDAGSRARARWRFACTSVLDRMRRKSFSWKFLKDRFAERRRFLELAVREQCVKDNLCPRSPLSEEEEEELYRLKCILCPMDIRYYYSFAADEITRRKFIGYGCDSCHGSILGSRLACLTCMNDSFTDTIDLCTSCIDTSCERGGFVHDPSHDLLKFDSVVLDGRLRWMIPEARSMVVRIKGEFRSSLKNRVEPVEKSSSSHGSQSKKEALTPAAPPKCRCCGKVVSIPCWVCLICTIDAYVCDECDAKKKEPMPGDPHELGEPLLRIADCNPPVEVVATEVKLAALEKKFDKVDQRLAALEDRVESRLSLMETMLKEYFSSSTHGNVSKGSDDGCVLAAGAES